MRVRQDTRPFECGQWWGIATHVCRRTAKGVGADQTCRRREARLSFPVRECHDQDGWRHFSDICRSQLPTFGVQPRHERLAFRPVTKWRDSIVASGPEKDFWLRAVALWLQKMSTVRMESERSHCHNRRLQQSQGMSERLTRRRFVRVASAGAAMGTMGLNCSRSSQADDESEKPVFRFLQWNDVHIDETEPPGYRLANEKMKYLVDWANREGTVSSRLGDRSRRHDPRRDAGNVWHRTLSFRRNCWPI